MNLRELVKIVDKCEEKYEDYVSIKMYGDGSGGLYDDKGEELTTWDGCEDIEPTLKGWLKE